MAPYFTKPQPVEAVQWHPSQGVLAGTVGVGCAICGPGYAHSLGMPICVNQAAHDPVNRPFALRVFTSEGERHLFDGWWLVQREAGKQEVYSPEDFARLFTDVDWEARVTDLQERLAQCWDDYGNAIGAISG